MKIVFHEEAGGLIFTAMTQEDYTILKRLWKKLIAHESGKPWLGPVVDEVEMPGLVAMQRLKQVE